MYHMGQYTTQLSELEDERNVTFAPRLITRMAVNGIESGITEKSQCCRKPVLKIDSAAAWGICVTSFIIMFIIDGIILQYGALYPDLLDSFENKRVALSLGGSLMVGVEFIIGPVASVMVTRFDFRKVIIAGSICCAVGLIGSSFVLDAWLFILLYSVLTGFGISLIYISIIIMTAHCFEKWRPLALGIMHSGTGFGLLVLPMIILPVTRALDWRWCLRIEAAYFLPVLALSCVYVTPPLFKTSGNQSMCKAIKNTFDVSLLRNPVFILLMISGFMSVVGFIYMATFIVDSSMQKGLSKMEANWALSIAGIANVVGRLFIGALSTRLHMYAPLLLAGIDLLSVVMISVESYLMTLPLIGIYSAVLGLQLAFDTVLMSVLGSAFLGMETASGAIAMLGLSRGIMLIVIIPVGGYLRDVTNNYTASGYFTGCCMFISAVFNIIAWLVNRSRNRGSFTPGDVTIEPEVMQVTERVDNKASECTQGPPTTANDGITLDTMM